MSREEPVEAEEDEDEEEEDEARIPGMPSKPCPQCDERFTTREGFLDHIVVHTSIAVIPHVLDITSFHHFVIFQVPSVWWNSAIGRIPFRRIRRG